MLSFWVVGEDDREYTGIIAPTLEDAEEIFWQGVLTDEYPFDAHLIQMILEDEEFEITYQVEDDDIISIEDAP